MNKSDWWPLITWLCAAYVFLGLAVFGLALTTHNWLLIVLSVLVYPLNLILLSYAKRQW